MTNNRRFNALLTILFAGWLSLASLPAASWPQFRGPSGDGHVPASTSQLPLKWTDTENVAWKTAIHGKAWSSPVVGENRVWLTTATPEGDALYAVSLDRKSGKILQDLKLFEVQDPQFCHKFNSYASPTPVLEGDRVYVTFGSPGTACLDSRMGRVLWHRRDFVCNHFRGAGSSPIIHKNLLIMHFDGSDHQYVVALDKKTGKTVWQTKRSVDFKDLNDQGKPKMDGDLRKAFSTPHVANLQGKATLLSLGAMAAYGYDPMTGKEIWRVEEHRQHSASTRPVFGGGLIVYPTGFARGQLYAVQPGGKGNVTESHVKWVVKRSVPNKPSILIKGDYVFMIDDGGIASCLKLATGEQVWNERVGGNYSSSPILAGDRIYFCSEEGKVTVVKAAPTFEVLSENKLPDGFMASPAAADGQLFLRTRKHLYCIGG